jgi:hypothetical protein
MRFLVGKDGLLLEGTQLMTAFYQARHQPEALRQPRMLQYLITDAKFDVNLIYPEYSHQRTPETNLLAKAIEAGSSAAVSTLIQLSAGPDLPG